jgi:mannose/fructose/N-acetylgalactosamine-specific phosphotransferase system component IID
MMWPLLEKFYPNDPEKVTEGLKRHMQFFNTEPRWGAVIHGLVIAMEEEKAMGADIPEDTIRDIKTSLMGPLAGLGDTLTQAIWRPLMLSICIGWAITGNMMGPVIYAIADFSFGTAITYWAFMSGYK